MKVSFVYVTMRPGGIDLLAESLARQAAPGDYELVVVDDYPGRAGRGRARAYLESRGLPVGYYGPGKPKSYPSSKLGLVNAMNTGALRARGDYLVFVHDYTLFPVGALAAWQVMSVTLPYARSLTHGVAVVHDAAPPLAHDDVVSWPGGPPPLRAREPWVPEKGEAFYLGVPAGFLGDANGFDERADAAGDYLIASLNFQTEVWCCPFRVNRTVVCHVIDHRAWEPAQARAERRDSLWRLYGHDREGGREPRWQARSPNPFDFRTLRALNRSSPGAKSTSGGLQ